MKTKVSVFVIVILVCICILGCGSSSGGSADNNSASGTTVITSIEDMQAVENFSGSLDYEYVFETDCQSDLEQLAETVYTPNGYYIMEYYYPPEGSYKSLMFYDYATEQFVYVCGKSNCSHDDSTCDAYFDTKEYPNSYLWYYEGYLYTSMLEEDYVCMCKISPDGSTRENVCTVRRLDIETIENEDGSISTIIYYPILQMHRGYVYYSTALGSSDTGELGRINLEGKNDTELICTMSLPNDESSIYRIKPYGKYIFFQMGYYEDDDFQTANLYVYDTESDGGIKKVCDEFSFDYTIFDNKVYYFDSNEDICVYDVNSGEAGLFFDLDTGNDYTFMFNSRIFAYDDCLVYEITDLENYEYDEETDTVYTYVYQLVINQDGELVQTLQPDDEKINPY